MKEVKAFIHRKRVAAVVHALVESGFRNLTVVDVKGMLEALGEAERVYSMEIGDAVITEAKLEVVREDGQVAEVVSLIRANARTGQSQAGWIYTTQISEMHPIGD